MSIFDFRKSAGKVLLLNIDEIEPSPYQARRVFDPHELESLSTSIRENGLLQPVSVRRRAVGPGYELIAGERRLRACKLAGMKEIPAIVQDFEDERTAVLGLLENVQRADLNPFEQARGIRDVVELWGCTQAEAAKRLGIAQPTLANKLRLLQLTDEQQTFVVENGLTERHARAVLRLPESRRDKALVYMARNNLSARAADAYVESLLEKKKQSRRIPMVRDVRIFLNTINHALKVMTDNGIPATATSKEEDGYIEYTVRIPTSSACGKAGESAPKPAEKEPALT